MARPIRYCEVDGCKDRSHGNGLCHSHYMKRRRAERPKAPKPPSPEVPCSIEGCEEIATVKGMCRRHYARSHWQATYVPVARKTPEERFWEKVDRRGPEDCWDWRGGTTNGYGSFGYSEARRLLAHRFAYELLVGPIPDGAHLHHFKCERRICVNPAHVRPIDPDKHVVETWISALRDLGYTVIPPS